MKDDCAELENRPCLDHRPPRPINLHADPPPDDSGFLIIRFRAGALQSRKRELAAAAKEAGLLALIKMFEAFDLTARPLITSIGADEIERLEQAALKGELPPLRSLSNYWRVDTRKATRSLEEIEAALGRFPEIELLYREKTPSDPVNPGDDT